MYLIFNFSFMFSEFLLGEDILVAPVLDEGATSRDIYLPNGQWVDKLRSEKIIGPKWLKNYTVALNELAYFTRVPNITDNSGESLKWAPSDPPYSHTFPQFWNIKIFCLIFRYSHLIHLFARFFISQKSLCLANPQTVKISKYVSEINYERLRNHAVTWKQKMSTVSVVLQITFV